MKCINYRDEGSDDELISNIKISGVRVIISLFGHPTVTVR